jgi:hypothetical protein
MRRLIHGGDGAPVSWAGRTGGGPQFVLADPLYVSGGSDMYAFCTRAPLTG